MSSIVVLGDTSGGVTLSAPAVAGTVTVTLPATSGTMAVSGASQSFTDVTATGNLTVDGNTILGNASTDTLNVGNGGLVKDASGNVGIGTSSPSGRTHIVSAAGTVQLKWSDGTNGTANLDTASGVSRIWSNVGLAFGTGAETYTERMRIDSSGNVGIGINNPSLRLDLSGATLSNSNVTTPTTFALRANLQYCFAADSTPIGNLNNARSLGVRNYYNSTSTNYPSSYGTVTAFQHYAGSEIGVGSAYITQMAVGHSTTPVVYYRNSDVTTGATFSNWYSVNLTSVSDVRAKKDIVDATSQLGVLTQLEVKQFSFINENDAGTQIGMIAQQVDSVDPYYVTKDLDNPDMMWRVHYDKMIPMLVKSIQEQQAIIQTLTDRITALENK